VLAPDDGQWGESSGWLLITASDAVLLTDFRYELTAREQAPLYEVVVHGQGLARALKPLLEQSRVRRLGFEAEAMLVLHGNQLARVLGEKVELVPTTNIVLNWAVRNESHKYDEKLSPITVRSGDGFAFNLDVAQIIHIGSQEASKVISRVGSVQNLVDHVLQPIVGNYFRNAAQQYTALDFLGERGKRQVEAAQYVHRALSTYDVEAIDTLIGDIDLPEELLRTQTERKIAEEERKTYEAQKLAQEQRQLLVRETSMADIQREMVKAERGVEIARLEADATIEAAKGGAEATRLQAEGDAAAILATGKAQARAYRLGAEALGGQSYVSLQLMQLVGQNSVRIVPDVSVSGGSGSGLVDGLLGVMLHNQIEEAKAPAATATEAPSAADDALA